MIQAPGVLGTHVANVNESYAGFNFQHETKEWAKTILSLKDTKPSRLPIVDVLVKDIGTVRQKFRLEIGPVCFV
jgi:hypothetical protein